MMVESLPVSEEPLLRRESGRLISIGPNHKAFSNMLRSQTKSWNWAHSWERFWNLKINKHKQIRYWSKSNILLRIWWHSCRRLALTWLNMYTYRMKTRIKTRKELHQKELSIARRSYRNSTSYSRPPDKQDRAQASGARCLRSSRCTRCSKSTNERFALKSQRPMTCRA